MKPQGLNIPNYRPDTAINAPDIGIVYHYGGVGDFIQWTQAIIYNLKNYKYLKGEIFVKPFFHELAVYWLTPHLDGRFKIVSTESYSKNKEIDKYRNLISALNGVMTTLNSSIMSVGFMSYAQLDYVPEEYNHFPVIDCSKIDISKFNLDSTYCVITTMSTSGVRTLKPVTINSITKYVKSIGLEPVFLGKEELDSTVDYKATTSEEVDYSHGIDLRNKTTLLEAAAIMNGAKFVVGLDNGLLHLASCTDANIIFAFNTVRPEHRLIPRKTKTGKTLVITPDKEKLQCTFCQSDTKFMFGHRYTECLYTDKKCLDYLHFDAFKKMIGMFL